MNFLKLFFFLFTITFKSYSLDYNVQQRDLKLLDSSDNRVLTSKYFTNCIAVIIFNTKNKERLLFHVDPQKYGSYYKNIDLIRIFINKSDKDDLKSFIIARSESIYNLVANDVINLFCKNKLLYDKIMINTYFDIKLFNDGLIKITETEKSNLLKEIKIETELFAERKASITEIVKQEFINEQLTNLENMKQEVNKGKNIIKKRIFNSPILDILIKDKMMVFNDIKNLSYFDVLLGERNSVIPCNVLRKLKRTDEKVIESIMVSDAEENLLDYIISNSEENVELLFSILNMYENLSGNICKFLPLNLGQFEILKNYNIKKLILKNKIPIRETLNLSAEKTKILQGYGIRKLLLKNKISIQEALNLSIEKSKILEGDGIRELLLKNKISIQEALNLSIEKSKILEGYGIKKLLLNDKISIQEALNEYK